MRVDFRGSSPMIDKAVTLFPEPDSPTRATVLPTPISKLTPSTTVFHPPACRKEATRFLTERTLNLPSSPSEFDAIADSVHAIGNFHVLVVLGIMEGKGAP